MNHPKSGKKGAVGGNFAGGVEPAVLPTTWRYAVLALFTAAALLAVVMLPRIPQDPAYHRFADQRTLFAIPHFWNVVSNLPFLLIAALGFRFLALRLARPGAGPLRTVAERRLAGLWLALTGLVGLGSGWYHLHPVNATLVLDRLALGGAFMAVFGLLLAERIGARFAARATPPLVVAAMGSVLWWIFSEAYGRGDLRLYGFFQFYPLAAIFLLLLLFPARYTGGAAWLLAVGIYALAKLAEFYDGAIYAATGGLGGHTLKHFLGAGAVYVLFRMVERRRELP